jgi:glycosyltransferase involved in cell wall biosynthesis
MLAILTTHPIQYQVPLWQALARDGRVPFEVWYLTDHGTRRSMDREFGQIFAWDIDTLSGYTHYFLDVEQGATPSSFWKCRLRERLRHRLRASSVNAIWIQGWQVAAYWQAVLEARSIGVEVWLRGESNDLAPQPPWKRTIKRIRNGWLFQRVDKLFYIGKANRRLYEECGVPEAKLFPAPYAVDNERFALQATGLRPQRKALREQWGIPEDAFCVLFCGKFIPKKRPLDLIAAARALLEKGVLSKLHLLFVGSGVLGPELRRACRVLYDSEGKLAAPQVESTNYPSVLPPASFAGFLNQKEISRAYVAADCLVLPSDYRETWGLVVNESLASSLPCLVSQACGCAEELSSFDTFAAGDIEALSSQLVRLAQQGCKIVSPPTISESVSSIVRAYCESNTLTPEGQIDSLLDQSGKSAR